DQLAAQVPPPSAYTPHLWRQYLEALLRHEQLLRADDAASAEKIRSEVLPALEKKIRAARERKLYSAFGSLAMAGALGVSPAVGAGAKKRGAADPAAAELEKLWGEKDPVPALRKKIAEWVEPEKDRWQSHLLRVRLSGLLARHAAANPETALKPAAQLLTDPQLLLTATVNDTAPRPTE